MNTATGLHSAEPLCSTSEKGERFYFEEEIVVLKTCIGSRIVEAFDNKSCGEIACFNRISS